MTKQKNGELKIYQYQDVSSTNDIANKLAQEGAKEWTVVIANSQNKGKGRLGRNWFSPPCKNIYLSCILRPQINPQYGHKITLCVALSILEAINELYKINLLYLKWPNDLIVEKKKLGGILTEIKTKKNIIDYAIVGIGLNVNMEEEDFPQELKSISTSLKCTFGYSVSKKALITEILKKLKKNYFIFKEEGFLVLLPKIKSYLYHLGKFVKIISSDKIFEGETIDLDENGALLIRDENGFITTISVGEVIKVS